MLSTMMVDVVAASAVCVEDTVCDLYDKKEEQNCAPPAARTKARASTAAEELDAIAETVDGMLLIVEPIITLDIIDKVLDADEVDDVELRYREGDSDSGAVVT